MYIWIGTRVEPRKHIRPFYRDECVFFIKCITELKGGAVEWNE